MCRARGFARMRSDMARGPRKGRRRRFNSVGGHHLFNKLRAIQPTVTFQNVPNARRSRSTPNPKLSGISTSLRYEPLICTCNRRQATAVELIQAKYAFTERRACRLLLVPVSSYRYKPRHRDEDLHERLVALACEKPRFGYRRLHVLLERGSEHVNHKRVHRIYREVVLLCGGRSVNTACA
jgi:hypothetical protein